VDMLAVEAAIRRLIQELKPHLVLTCDPHGGYYHPDHLAVQRATTAAFFSSGTLGDSSPERLFYGTMRRDVFRVLSEKSRGRHTFVRRRGQSCPCSGKLWPWRSGVAAGLPCR
jgi:LmbE family N-acetylglucosaminyl deacetylase